MKLIRFLAAEQLRITVVLTGQKGGPWTGLVDLLCGAIRRHFMRALRTSGGGGEGES